MASLFRPLVVAGAAAAVVVAASVTLASRSGSRRGPVPAPPPRSSTSTSPSTSTSRSASDPAGPSEAPTVDGARAAALAYLGLSERVVDMDVDAAVAAQRDAASTAAASGLVADLRQRLDALHAAFPGGGLHYRVGVLAVRAMPATGAHVQVDVWYVGVLSGADVAPYEQWRLSRYDLVWERGAWRVAAETSGPGPRPAAPPGPEPTNAGTLEAALGGFTSALAP